MVDGASGSSDCLCGRGTTAHPGHTVPGTRLAPGSPSSAWGVLVLLGGVYCRADGPGTVHGTLQSRATPAHTSALPAGYGGELSCRFCPAVVAPRLPGASLAVGAEGCHPGPGFVASF